MLLRTPNIVPSAITPPDVYFNRRASLAGAVAAAGATVFDRAHAAVLPADAKAALSYTFDRAHSVDALVHAAGEDETPNSWAQITNYNNYYEFGVAKTDPAEYAGTLQTRPWSVAIEGEAEITGSFLLEEIVKPYALEERIYRFRCVEAWSMVIPWVGVPGTTIHPLEPFGARIEVTKYFMTD